MSTDRHLHLAVITSFSASPHTIGQWRLPRSYKGFDFRRLDYWEHLARTLERGRVGWNIVTSYSDAEARQFGLSSIPDHDARYDRADEYVALCRPLWASWEPDALVFDQEAGVFADPAKVHRIDHDGEWFRCQGPLHVPPGPQGRPLLIQAGSSTRGIEFCARHAEVHFALPGAADDLDGVAAHRDALEAALVAAGRDPSEVKVAPRPPHGGVGGQRRARLRHQPVPSRRDPAAAGPPDRHRGRPSGFHTQ